MPEQFKEITGGYFENDGSIICKMCDREVHQLVYEIGEKPDNYTQMFACLCGNRVKVYRYTV